VTDEEEWSSEVDDAESAISTHDVASQSNDNLTGDPLETFN
jgi:hypothetical protein